MRQSRAKRMLQPPSTGLAELTDSQNNVLHTASSIPSNMPSNIPPKGCLPVPSKRTGDSIPPASQPPEKRKTLVERTGEYPTKAPVAPAAGVRSASVKGMTPVGASGVSFFFFFSFFLFIFLV